MRVQLIFTVYYTMWVGKQLVCLSLIIIGNENLEASLFNILCVFKTFNQFYYLLYKLWYVHCRLSINVFSIVYNTKREVKFYKICIN